MWTDDDARKPETVFDYIPLEKRILWLIESALAHGPASLDEILQRIFTSLKNGRTPQNREILAVLEASSVQMPNGNWRLKTTDDSAIQLQLGGLSSDSTHVVEDNDDLTHDQFIRLIAEWAPRSHLIAHIGRTERRGNPSLRDIGLPNLSIPGLSENEIRDNRIDEIDVVWLRHGTLPVALFEVEHTTRAMTCIPRLGNLTRLMPHLAIDVFIVAPDRLLGHVERQVRTPSGLAIVGDHPSRWHFLPYSAALNLQDRLLDQADSLDLTRLRGLATPISADVPAL